jgi:hypoxanthine phosphoribosyltransferase
MVGMGADADVAQAPGGRRARPTFAHPSEGEFAAILDFYQLAWEYEPRSFPLRYDDSGRVVESFTPDFYLPELDLFIELTTLKQSLVTKKNRKLRRLRELYPEVKIKLLYNRDYRNLLFKYGLQVHGGDHGREDGRDGRAGAG